MNPDRWRRIEALYHQALERPSAERAAFLAAACSDDGTIRREVESLLAESESASSDSFLAKPPLAMPAEIGQQLTDRAMIGRSLGAYAP